MRSRPAGWEHCGRWTGPGLSVAGQTVTYDWGGGLRELDHNRAGEGSLEKKGGGFWKKSNTSF
jgi:hypothetical protein